MHRVLKWARFVCLFVCLLACLLFVAFLVLPILHFGRWLVRGLMTRTHYSIVGPVCFQTGKGDVTDRCPPVKSNKTSIKAEQTADLRQTRCCRWFHISKFRINIVLTDFSWSLPKPETLRQTVKLRTKTRLNCFCRDSCGSPYLWLYLRRTCGPAFIGSVLYFDDSGFEYSGF